MVLGNIQGLEVVVIRFDLGPLDDGKTEAGKNFADLGADLGYGMKTPVRHCAPGQRNIHLLLEQPLVPAGLDDGLQGAVKLKRDDILDLVAALAQTSAIFRSDLADISQHGRQETFSAQVLCTDSEERLLGDCGSEFRFRTYEEFLQGLHHDATSPFTIVTIWENPLGS